MRIFPSNPLLSAMTLVVLALSVTSAPTLGADSAKSAAAAPEIEADEISEAKVLLTLLGGKPVYGNWNDISD